MSYAWSFHSFSDEAFRNVFGRSSPQQVGKLIKSAEYALGDVSPEISRASRSMLMSGISYAGLDPVGSRAMDEVIKLAFSPEGFEAELEVEHLSPEGINPAAIYELMQRLEAPAPLLTGLLRGRRFGQAEPADCNYCIFQAGEVSEVLHEIINACAADSGAGWSDNYLPDILQECLIEPFEAAMRAGRPLFCHLS